MADTVALPLSRAERQTIMEAVRAIPVKGSELAERLDAEWELDPATRMVVLQMQGLAIEVRTLRWWTLGIVVLAMVIQAGMVGLGLSLDLAGRGSVTVTPAVPAAIEAPTNDDAALLDTADDILKPVPTL